MKKHWTVAMGVIIGAMVFGLAAVAAAPYVALAQTATQAAATTAPGASATTAPSTANGPGAGHPRGGFHGPRESQALVSAAASVTGLTEQEVQTQLEAGQSLTQIVTAKGKTAADVIAAARTAIATELAQDVTGGKITQAQADAELADFDQQAPQIMADTTLGTQAGPGFGHGGPGAQGGLVGPGGLISATVSITGLTDQEVDTQLQAGQTLAQIAQSKGKTADDVIAAARAALTTKLQADVTAGRLTQAQSDAKLAQFNSSATQIMNDATLGQHAGGLGGLNGPRGAGGPHALIDAAVSVTGLTDQAIDTQLQAGQSLAQIAQSQGKTADDVIAAARTVLTTQLQADVTAGRLTQAQSDARLAQFNSTATQIVNDTTLGQHAGGPSGHGGNFGERGPNGSNGGPANPTPSASAAGTTNS